MPYFAIFSAEEDFNENTATFQRRFVNIFDSVKMKNEESNTKRVMAAPPSPYPFILFLSCWFFPPWGD